MTLYTIMPSESIWPANEINASYSEVELDNVVLQVQIESGNRATIVRLLRCELYDYLNPAYAPGQEIVYTPNLKGNG